MITTLQSQYVQKSRIFLYPLLGIRRGVSVTPVETYMLWKDAYTVNDYKLIVTYHLRDDGEFKEFEDNSLLGNKLFSDFFELENGIGAYVFDFSELKLEYKRIVNGKYSRLSEKYKRTILSFFRNHKTHHAYIQSYLQPEKFIDDYARLLKVKPSLIRGVGELCNLPDLNLEELRVNKKVLNFDSVNNL